MPGLLRKRRDIKVQLRRQLIDGRTDVLEMLGHLCVVDVLGELVRCLFVLSVQLCEVESTNRVPVVLGVFPSYHWVVAVEPYRPVVMRDGEGEDLPVDFILIEGLHVLVTTARRRGGRVTGVLNAVHVFREPLVIIKLVNVGDNSVKVLEGAAPCRVGTPSTILVSL